METVQQLAPRRKTDEELWEAYFFDRPVEVVDLPETEPVRALPRR